jgi:hypothetical protein
MIVVDHFTESLTPFDSSGRFINDAERPKQAVFQPLMITLVMVVDHKLCDRILKRLLPEENHRTPAFFLDGTDKSFRECVQARRPSRVCVSLGGGLDPIISEDIGNGATSYLVSQISQYFSDSRVPSGGIFKCHLKCKSLY